MLRIIIFVYVDVINEEIYYTIQMLFLFIHKLYNFKWRVYRSDVVNTNAKNREIQIGISKKNCKKVKQKKSSKIWAKKNHLRGVGLRP